VEQLSICIIDLRVPEIHLAFTDLEAVAQSAPDVLAGLPDF
jgi:hypothetical protein